MANPKQTRSKEENYPGQVSKKVFQPVRSKNNSTELFIDGPEILSMLLDQIKKTKHFIHVQVMLFYSDDAGFKIAKALADRVEEGVEVRVMSDSEMSTIVRAIEKYRSSGTSNFDALKKLFSDTGVKFVSSDEETYWFPKWDEKREKLKEKGVPEEFLEMQDMIQDGISWDLNVFDHRKLMVFDGESAVVTGSNIGNKYLYDHEPAPEDKKDGHFWHDGAVLIHGPCASVLNKHFASKWMVRGGDVFDYTKHFRSKEEYGEDTCTVYEFFPGMKENHIRNWYLEKVKTCKGDLIIENPYINDGEFWDILSRLDKEQAEKITVINPYGAEGNDYVQNVSAIKCRMWKPFKNGINFYAYNKRMTHWKIALYEETSEVFIGSYNLNHRSALHDFEMNVLIESPELAGKVKEMLKNDMEDSKRITELKEFHEHPRLHASCLLLDITEYFE